MKFQGHAQLQGPTDSRQWMRPENQPMLARMREDCRIPKKVLKARPKLGERGIWTSFYAGVHYVHVVYGLGLRVNVFWDLIGSECE